MLYRHRARRFPIILIARLAHVGAHPLNNEILTSQLPVFRGKTMILPMRGMLRDTTLDNRGTRGIRVKVVTLTEIQSLADRIVREFDPVQIILFGSYADGTASPDSDVDLLVVLPFEGRNLDKSVEILVKIAPSFPIDLLARKPDDVTMRYKLGDPLIRSAIDYGKILHARAA